MKEEDLCELILENAHVLTCFNCGETLASTMNFSKWRDAAAVLYIDPGESNYPHEPDISASAFFECMECHHHGTDTEINVLKRKIKELEAACAHYKAHEDQLIDMIERIESIEAVEDEEYAV